MILFAVLVVSPVFVHAQWTPGGNSTTADISRTGKVGVMTTGTPSSQFHVFTATSMDGIAVDGSNNPAINFRNSGTIKGYLGLATAANAFFSGSAVNDLILRSEGGSIHLGQGAGTPTLTVSGGNVGIGTTGPNEPVEISNSGNADLRFTRGSSSGYIGITNASYILTGAAAGDMAIRSPAALWFGAGGNNTRMVVTSAGNVGIGVTTPNRKLMVVSSGTTEAIRAEAPTGINAINIGTGILSVDAPGIQNGRFVVTDDGSVGVGSPIPIAPLQVTRYGSGDRTVLALSGGTGWNTSAIGDTVAIAMDTYNSGSYPVRLKSIQRAAAPNYPNNDFAIATNTNGTEVERVRVLNNGNVGIGLSNPAYALDVNGTIHATNVIGASFQDLAEWVPASTEMTAGTVVVLSPEKNNEVMPSASAYDSTVAGVVSAKPGIILGEPSAEKAQVATTGRVRVKVDATKEPIKIGDLLVTSDKPGTAMKSIPVNLSGIAMHRPGTIIGKALEPLASGIGEVLVLLSLQ